MKYNSPSKRLVNGSADLAQVFQHGIPDNKLAAGSIKNKFPVYLSDGKTVIYVNHREDIEAARAKWEAIINKPFGT